MRKKKLFFWALANSFGAVVYVGAVAWFLYNAPTFFGQMNSFWGPFGLLLLFVCSALVTGGLLLGSPIYLYFENGKKESLKLLAYTAIFLFCFTASVFAFGVYYFV